MRAEIESCRKRGRDAKQCKSASCPNEPRGPTDPPNLHSRISRRGSVLQRDTKLANQERNTINEFYPEIQGFSV